MFLWITLLTLTLICLIFSGMVWIRKLQFDTIHRNFLKLKSELGGEILRAGFAVRPSYSGHFKGQKVHISITSEGRKSERKYYIGITMQAAPKINFVIKSADWLNKSDSHSQKNNAPQKSKDKSLPINDGQHILEANHRTNIKHLTTPLLEDAVKHIAPFAYILIGKSGMLLERISINLPEDTESAPIQKIFEGMYKLKKVVE